MLRLTVVGGCLLWAWLVAAWSDVQTKHPAPQRLFAVPYGTTQGTIYLDIIPGKHDYEPTLVEGPAGLLVAPNGSRIVIVVWCQDNEIHKIVEELLIYDRFGKFINKIFSVEEEKFVDGVPFISMIDCIIYGLNIYIIKVGKILVYNDQGIF